MRGSIPRRAALQALDRLKQARITKRIPKRPRTKKASIVYKRKASSFAHLGLGTLAKLPQELRDMVYEHLRPVLFIPHSGRPKSTLKLLECSKEVSYEFSLHIFPKMYNSHLYISLYPTSSISWFTFQTLYGWETHLSSFEDAIQRGFQDIPYDRFPRLTIEMFAPDDDELGQFLCLWRKVADLVKLLERAKALPNVAIRFMSGSPDEPWAFWTLQRWTIPVKWKHNARLLQNDLMLPLALFRRIRGVADVEISFEPSVYHSRTDLSDTLLLEALEETADLTKAVMMQRKPFDALDRSYGHNEWAISDYMIQDGIDRIFAHCDRWLDIIRGRSADMMRLHRFCTWFEDIENGTSYGQEIAALLKIPDIWPDLLDDEPNEDRSARQGKAAFSFRRTAMFALYPLSVPMEKKGIRGEYCWGLPGSGDWDPAEWRSAYPEGIPRFNSQRFKSVWLESQMGMCIFSCPYERARQLTRFFSPQDWAELLPKGTHFNHVQEMGDAHDE